MELLSSARKGGQLFPWDISPPGLRPQVPDPSTGSLTQLWSAHLCSLVGLPDLVEVPSTQQGDAWQDLGSRTFLPEDGLHPLPMLLGCDGEHRHHCHILVLPSKVCPVIENHGMSALTPGPHPCRWRPARLMDRGSRVCGLGHAPSSFLPWISALQWALDHLFPGCVSKHGHSLRSCR